jgi:hypothetical protein
LQALRLMEIFPEAIVAAAALDAMRPGAISFGAQASVRRLRKLACVKQLVIAKVERRPPSASFSSRQCRPEPQAGFARFDLGDYPYLPVANVKTTSAADDAVPVSGRAA